MAERLLPLRVTQEAPVQIPAPARPMIRLVWERWLFSVALRPETRSQALQLKF
jgi:hypothetical protein